MSDLTIRTIQSSEFPVLKDFLYNAIYIPEGGKRPLREIIFEPEIYIYIKDFGWPDDCSVIAEQDGRIVGAGWTRIIPAYGHKRNVSAVVQTALKKELNLADHR